MKLASVSVAALIAIGVGSSAQAELSMVPTLADFTSWASGIGADQFANIKPIAGAELFVANYATSDEDPTMTMATSELDSDGKWFIPGSEEMMVNIKPIAGAYSADVLAAAKAAVFGMDALGVQVEQFANIKPIAGAERFAVNYVTNNDGMDVMKAYTSNGVSGTWTNAMNDNSIWNATVINYK